MDNIELLKSFGFVEIDSWLCNPTLSNEGVFFLKPGDLRYVHNYTVEDLIRIITSTAINFGFRKGCNEERIQIKKELEGNFKKLVKTVSSPRF